eukprot:1155343-Pelagomonas_calceolata.AAC.3
MRHFAAVKQATCGSAEPDGATNWSPGHRHFPECVFLPISTGPNCHRLDGLILKDSVLSQPWHIPCTPCAAMIPHRACQLEPHGPPSLRPPPVDWSRAGILSLP